MSTSPFARPEGQTGTSSVAPVRPVPHVRKPPEHQRFFNELKSHPEWDAAQSLLKLPNNICEGAVWLIDFR